MAQEIERVLYQAEDFLRRNVLRPKSAREAHKRRARRKFAEVLRRIRRAGFIVAGLLVALVVTDIVASVGFVAWIVAVPTIFLIAFLSLFWPTRRREAPVTASAPASPRSLTDMAIRVEEGLIDRIDELPARALPAADAVIARLGELQPHLSELEPNSLAAGDARRLICEHLPRLVDSYLGLPPAMRGPQSDSSQRFAESLATVAEEIEHLLETCCRDKQLSFDTQHRFIETRYRDHRALKGE
jgi:hypothetical protein